MTNNLQPITDSAVSRVLLSEEESFLVEIYSNDCLLVSKEKDPIKKEILMNKLIDQYRSVFGFTKQDVKLHISLLNVANDNKDEQEVYTIEDILKLSEDSPEYLVPPLLKDGGGLYILSAAPKVGKTLLAYNLLYSVAVSGEFLGFPCNLGNVLMYECEEPKSTFVRRLNSKGVEKFNPALSQIVNSERIFLKREFDISNLEQLKEDLKKYRPRLVIFDSLRAITSSLGVSENDVKISHYLYAVQRVLSMNDTTGIIIHHNKKDAKDKGIEGMSGSLSIAGACDGMILLHKGNQKGSDLHIELHTHPRDGLPVSFLIKRTFDENGYWAFELIEELHIDPKIVTCYRRILRHLSKYPEKRFSEQEIAQDISFDVRDKSFLSALERLKDSGQVNSERVLVSEDPIKVSCLYWISSRNPWRKLTGTDLENDFVLSEKLLEVTSSEDLDELIGDWSQEKKSRIWRLFNDEEKTRILTVTNPPQFQVGDWVRVTTNDEELLEKISSMKFDYSSHTWVYSVQGKSKVYNEVDLQLDENYATTTPSVTTEFNL